MRSWRRPLQLLGYLAWMLMTVLLVAIAGLGLAGAIAHSAYDPHENRAPAARIAVAAVALAVALAALSISVRRLRGTRGKPELGAGLALTAATILLLFLLVLIELASGPL